MASFPPEHPELEPENALPEQPHAEPRLLTRRDTGTAAGNGTGRNHHTRHLRSLDRLRARIGGTRSARREDSIGIPGITDIPDTWKTQRRRAVARGLRRLVVSLIVLAVCCCLALVVFALHLRQGMRAALPQLDGDLHLAGLTAPVSVTRDEQGVPTLEAATLDDLLFAQGFVTAQDRLWQMDALRRHAAGELAEILGPSLLEHDRQQRILQLRAAADRAVLTLLPDQLAQLQAYARGVNAFLESSGDRLPVEFRLLHYTPVPWTPRDSLLVSLAMFQDLGTSYPTKLRREALSQHLPPELLADLYPTRSFRDQPPTQPPPDLVAPKPAILQIPLDDTQVKLRKPAPPTGPARLAELLASHGVSDQLCPECRAGSNNWAVSGRRSASGKPLVSNDMHLSLGIPDIWYEAGLHTSASPAEPALDVVGFTLPGVPFVIVGRNTHVAWAVTNLGADVQDLHVEHLRGSGDSIEFQQHDASWAPVAHHREFIRVRGGHDRVLDVLTTTAQVGGTTVETPIISPLFPSERRTLSLLWTPYDPHNLGSPFYAVNAAASGSALVASLASFGGPSLNLVYADDAGHIGYHALGRIPIRGPAERHARPAQETLPPDGAPPPDEDPSNGSPGNETHGGESTPQAREVVPALLPRPRFVTAAYVRRRRLSRPAETRPRVRLRPSPMKSVPEESIAPAPAVIDYTIGSPLPAVPVDALDAPAQWSGYIPFEELPAAQDPADGILATANARVTADDYPYFLADNWAPPYRTERIHKLLAGRTGLTPADMLHMETDTVSAFDRLLAERLVYALDHASAKAVAKDGKRLRQAADFMRSWAGGTPGNMTTDSPAAAIVAAVRPEFLSILLTAQIAQHDHLSPTDPSIRRLTALYDWGAQTVALESLLTFQPARWLPSGYASWNDLLAAAVERGLTQKSAPHDLSRWTYGSQHPVDLEHPVLSLNPLLSRLLGVHTGTGPQPIGGDGTTIQATSRAFGPSERFTADLAYPGATVGNITTGQSANPASPHFLDQFPAWLHGTTFAMPLHGAPAQHTLRLLP